MFILVKIYLSIKAEQTPQGELKHGLSLGTHCSSEAMNNVATSQTILS